LLRLLVGFVFLGFFICFFLFLKVFFLCSISKEVSDACLVVGGCLDLRKQYQSVMVDPVKGQVWSSRIELDDTKSWEELKDLTVEVKYNKDGVLFAEGFEVETLASYTQYCKVIDLCVFVYFFKK
jgi:hypothetical protein